MKQQYEVKTYEVEILNRGKTIEARPDTTIGQIRAELGLPGVLAQEGQEKPLEDSMTVGQLGTEARIRVMEVVGARGGYQKK